MGAGGGRRRGAALRGREGGRWVRGGEGVLRGVSRAVGGDLGIFRGNLGKEAAGKGDAGWGEGKGCGGLVVRGGSCSWEVFWGAWGGQRWSWRYGGGAEHG